ncbi:leucyl aminopeptidase [Candidatus Woesearchaeota archaeon]|nr:leucyl aminopeptidase [Candidatus Woesearchaeota archaeon]
MDVRFEDTIDTTKDLLVLGIFQEDDESSYEFLNTLLAKELQEALALGIFKKTYGEVYPTKFPGLGYRRVLVLALGKKEEMTLERVRRLMSKAVSSTKNYKLESFSTNILSLIETTGKISAEELGRAAAEGITLANYSFKKYLTVNPENIDKEIQSVTITWMKDKENLQRGFSQGKIIGECTNFAKDLVNEPPMIMTPAYMEKIAEEIAENKNVKLRVLDKKDLEEKGFGAMLAVARGSEHAPKLLILEYNGSEDGSVTALIGKGITFDTGGYNLKPTGFMETMKCDMGGAAAVLATIKCAAALGIKKKIIGVAPMCENSVSSTAYKPGDVLIAYNKKSIEVTNTDAEGRLILADAMAYTEEKYKPEIMIDLATLTGACVIALGSSISGIISTNKELQEALQRAGEASYDRVWPLPLLEEYKDSMKGSISDLKNAAATSYGAGAITASVFLSHFVKESKWAHIDIAGPAFLLEGKDYLQKGATGTGVRLLSYYFLRNS